MIDALLPQTHRGAGGIVRGRVGVLRDDGLVEVETPAPECRRLQCQVLVTEGRQAATLEVGDEVLVSMLPGPGADGVVLGRITTHLAGTETIGRESDIAAEATTECRNIAANRIVIEAGEELVLRCGKGTIKIQQDGKVIVRGENVLNSARGTMRIKGGSVGIN